MIHSESSVEGLHADAVCAKDCYRDCGDIANEAGFSNVGDDVILRWFHFRLSDLNDYIGTNPKRVFIYAQTIIFDVDIDVEFSLFIRARQVCILNPVADTDSYAKV